MQNDPYLNVLMKRAYRRGLILGSIGGIITTLPLVWLIR